MSNYSALKTAIQQAVYTNGNNEITGAGLQAVLLQIVNTVGDGYVFKGVATAGTTPGTPDANVFYIAPAGTYTNFGSSYTVPEGSIGVFTYNGSWHHGSVKVVRIRFANSILDCYITSQVTIDTTNGTLSNTQGWLFIGDDTARPVNAASNIDFGELSGACYIAYSLRNRLLYVVSYTTPLTSVDDQIVGVIDKSNNSAVVNCRKLTINGAVIVDYTQEEQEELDAIAEVTPLAEDITTPTSDWGAKAFNNYAGTDGVYWDIRNRIGPARRIKKIYVKSRAAGTMRIHFLSLTGETIYYQDYMVVNGVTTINPPALAYAQEMYVGAQNITSQLMLIYPTDNTGQSRKRFISDGHIIEQTYPYALWLDLVDSEGTLPYRVAKLEAESVDGITTLDGLKAAITNGTADIRLAECDITLDGTLSIASGTRITGIRGKSIIRVPSSVLKGVELDNIEDVVIDGITLIGAYNGTPTKSGLQPVKSGIVDTAEDARTFANAGYQTDLTNGGVTATYIPQIGINMRSCEKVEIIGCEIKNFSYYGIANALSGKNYRYACKFENNYINNCYCGIYIYKEAERSQYIANNVSLCQIGLYMDSGTNMFTDCAFSANRIGMFMNNGLNHAHGVQTGNAYTHCSLYSLYAYNVENGEVFGQCKFGYVDNETENNGDAIYVKNSRGLVFNNCQMIQCNIKFDGKFYLHYTGETNGTADQFGNTNYVVTYEDISGQASQYNGGVNQIIGSCYISGGGIITISSDLDDTNVVMKNNFYISGQDSSGVNN